MYRFPTMSIYDSFFFLYCLVVVLLAPWVCISISLYLYNDNKDHSFTLLWIHMNHIAVLILPTIFYIRRYSKVTTNATTHGTIQQFKTQFNSNLNQGTADRSVSWPIGRGLRVLHSSGPTVGSPAYTGCTWWWWWYLVRHRPGNSNSSPHIYQGKEESQITPPRVHWIYVESRVIC